MANRERDIYRIGIKNLWVWLADQFKSPGTILNRKAWGVFSVYSHLRRSDRKAKKAFASKDEALKALKKERRLELALEGHRFFDLARWGEIGPENQQYIEFESDYLPKYKGLTYDDKWICMPLPFDEINTMEGRLVQNANWK